MSVVSAANVSVFQIERANAGDAKYVAKLREADEGAGLVLHAAHEQRSRSGSVRKTNSARGDSRTRPPRAAIASRPRRARAARRAGDSAAAAVRHATRRAARSAHAAVGNTRTRSPRSANGKLAPSRHAELVRLVERAVDEHPLAVEAVDVDAREAKRPEEVDRADRARAARWASPRPGRCRRGSVLGPQVQPHRCRRARCRWPASRARPGRRGSARRPAHVAVQHVDLAEEVGDERRGRPLVDLARRADLLDRAVVHHDDAVGHRQRLFLVVRDHDRRHPSRCCSARISPRRRSRSFASSADSGSSSSSSDGAVASARASAMRCCWPPDSWLGILRARRRAGRRASAAR